MITRIYDKFWQFPTVARMFILVHVIEVKTWKDSQLEDKKNYLWIISSNILQVKWIAPSALVNMCQFEWWAFYCASRAEYNRGTLAKKYY